MKMFIQVSENQSLNFLSRCEFIILYFTAWEYFIQHSCNMKGIDYFFFLAAKELIKSNQLNTGTPRNVQKIKNVFNRSQTQLMVENFG